MKNVTASSSPLFRVCGCFIDKVTVKQKHWYKSALAAFPLSNGLPTKMQGSQPGHADHANQRHVNQLHSVWLHAVLVLYFPDKETRHTDLCRQIKRGRVGKSEKKREDKQKLKTWSSESSFSPFGGRCAMTCLVYIWNWEEGLSDQIQLKLCPSRVPVPFSLLSLLGSTHWENAFRRINRKWGQLRSVH